VVEHVFVSIKVVSIKGSAGRWFEAAVQRGDLAGALSEAAELPRPLALGYALGLVVLFAEHGDPRHGVAAARWAARVALERGLEVDELAELVRALSGARSGLDVMRRELEELAGRYGVPVGALLNGRSRRGAG